MTRLRPDGFLETTTLTRRTALGTLGAGFALVMQPVSAETIITSTEGLITRDIEFKNNDSHSPAYYARPEGKGPFPTVAVVSEVFGLHEHIKDLCRRLAKSGYAAIAPDYFYRAGDPSKVEDFQKVFQIVGQAGYHQVMSDTRSAMTWLANEPSADVNRLAITGFCWGGTVVWMAAATIDYVKAGAAWYGRLKASPPPPGAPPAEDRPWPVDVADKIDGKVIGFYAGQDQGITAADVEAMRDALKAAGDTKSNIIVYPDAQHGFNGDYRPSYNEAAAKDAWSKMLAWFKDRGVA